MIEKQEDKSENKIVSKEIDSKEKQRKILERKQEKVIIRDPKHSEYRFISSLLKCILYIIKGIVGFLSLGLIILLILSCVGIVISFLFIQTGLVFLGSLCVMISITLVLLILLNMVYNFMVNHKNKRKIQAITFLLSLFMMGTGIGMFLIGFSQFQYIHNIDSKDYISTEETYVMDHTLILEPYYTNIQFIEEDSNQIRIETRHSKIQKIKYNIEEMDNGKIFSIMSDVDDDFESFRMIINDINHRKIINYDQNSIMVYTSKENIEVLKENRKAYEKK